MIDYKDLPLKCKPFANHGVSFSGKSGESHLAGECPFCGKEEHFFVSQKTGQYKCHVCGEAGNTVTFLTAIAVLNHEETDREAWRALARDRGLPVAAFKSWGLGWDGEQWTLPCRSPNGMCHDLRRWFPGRSGLRSTSGCKVQLFGLDRLRKSKPNVSVWLCEGEWDAIALAWLLKRNGRKDAVMAVPGANTFKEEWAEEFDGRDVYLVYDADEAGDKGSLKAASLLKRRGRTRSLHFLSWPMDAPKGWDCRDWIAHGWAEHRHELNAVLAQLEALLTTEHRLGPNARDAAGLPEDDEAGDWGEDTRPEKPVRWADMLATFEAHLDMDEDMKWALTLCCATVVSIALPKDPLWFYLIAPPGGGKTTVLNTFRGSQRCVFRSSLTPASLVSGFRAGHDPSLIPKLSGKTGVFKDGTELLALHPGEKAAIDSIFRGAYDGDVDKSYGNAVERHYRGIHFTMLIGMTPAVHADSQSALGERFLKFQMQQDIENRREDLLWAAFRSIGKEARADAALQEIVAGFLWRELDPDHLPHCPRPYMERIMALAQLVGILRASVSREQFGDRRILYKPHPEIGTRLVKQLGKLAYSVAHVWEKKAVDDEVWRLVERVAFDTAIGFHLDIVQAIMHRGGKATTAELAEETSLPASTLIPKLDDLRMLRVLKKQDKLRALQGRGRPPREHELSPKIVELWKRACVVDDHTKRAARVRRRRKKINRRKVLT